MGLVLQAVITGISIAIALMAAVVGRHWYRRRRRWSVPPNPWTDDGESPDRGRGPRTKTIGTHGLETPSVSSKTHVS
jgi:hypothetical protein